MNKKLDLIKLARGMDVKDKAKLLFADCLKKFETMGEEYLLNPLEKDTLVEDARKNNQISDLNILINKFNLTCMLLNNIKIAYLNFLLKKSRLEIAMVGVLLRNHYEDAIDFLIYDLARQGYKDEQLENSGIQKKVGEKAMLLRKKYGLESDDKFSAMFDLFEPPIKPESYFTSHFKNIEYRPNPLIQEAFMNLVHQAKKLREALYKIRYLEQIAGLELLSEIHRRDVESYEASITELEQLEGLLSSLKLYQFDDFMNDLKIGELSEPLFLQTIKNIIQATELSDEDKKEAERYVNALLKLI